MHGPSWDVPRIGTPKLGFSHRIMPLHHKSAGAQRGPFISHGYKDYGKLYGTDR